MAHEQRNAEVGYCPTFTALLSWSEACPVSSVAMSAACGLKQGEQVGAKLAIYKSHSGLSQRRIALLIQFQKI